MTWVTITGAGTTTATRFKGDILNKISNMFSAVDVSDTVKIHTNVTWSFVSNSFRIRNPADTYSFIFTPAAISANRIVNIPLLTADDTLLFIVQAQTITGAKTFNDSTLLIRNTANTFTTTIIGGTCTSSNNLTIPALTQTSTIAIVPQTYQDTPANPTGTGNTTGKMMGLGGVITPRITGKLRIHICGDMSNDTATDGAKVNIRYGTGSVPTNGAALTGTAIGGQPNFTQALAGQQVPFDCEAIVSGLTVGTQHWIDVGLAAITGGTASIKNVSITAFEL